MSHAPLSWCAPSRKVTFDLRSVGLEDEPIPTGGACVRDLFLERGVERASWSEEPLVLTAGAATHVGRSRTRNEDAFATLDEEALYVVADGMGGHAGGAIASQTAIEAVSAEFRERRRPRGLLGSVPPRAMELLSSFAAANEAIRSIADRSPTLSEMGTTLVAAHFLRRHRVLAIAHVGDSRCYRVRNGRVEQLTRDHSVPALTATGRAVHRLSRAVGPSQVVQVDLAVVAPQDGDTYLLCSDGLNKMLSHAEIRAALSGSVPPDRCAAELVDSANRAGGIDNVTAVVVRVGCGTRS